MANTVRKVRYCYVVVSNRAGEGSRVLAGLRKAGVNLLAFAGFPASGGKAQIDLVTGDIAGLQKVAKKSGWRLSAVKKGLLVQGTDRVGAVHRQLDKLVARRISVVAAHAIAAGQGRYGMIIWIKAKDYARAARALRAR